MSYRSAGDFKRAIENLHGFVLSKKLEDVNDIPEWALEETTQFLKKNLIEILKQDPYNLIVISDYILRVDPGSPLKQVLYDYRKDVQRLVWVTGANTVLWNMKSAREALLNSLKSSPGNISWGNSSDAAESFRKDDDFQVMVLAELKNKKKQIAEQKEFSGKLEVNTRDLNYNLFFTFGKITMEYKAKYDRWNRWQLEFKVEDRYDFDDYRIRDKLVEAFKKGSDKLGLTFGDFANDIGLFSQKEGVIAPYYIRLEFKYEIEVKP